MLFVGKKSQVTITFKAHDMEEGLQPAIRVLCDDGSMYSSGVMDDAGNGLYTWSMVTPNVDCFLCALVGSAGGTICVGAPKTMKLFYHDMAPESTRYILRDPKSGAILQQGEMENIGNDTYVISTTLDGLVQVIAGKRDGATLLFPLRQGSMPIADSIKIIGEFNKVSRHTRDRR